MLGRPFSQGLFTPHTSDRNEGVVRVSADLWSVLQGQNRSYTQLSQGLQSLELPAGLVF